MSEVTAHEAAAFWGCARGIGYSTEERLRLALAALEFFGKEYELWDEVEFEPTRWFRVEKEGGLLWAESSDEDEVRAAAKGIGQTPQHLYEKVLRQTEWRDI